MKPSIPSLAGVGLIKGSSAFFSEITSQAANHLRRARWFHEACLPDGSIFLRWVGLFEFVISADGRRIAGRPLAKASEEAFATYLLGQVLSYALLKQGIEPLHCTAVVVDGHALGFLGDCGYGKSSLGAAFLSAGGSLLTDDLLVLKKLGRNFVAYPGLPRIKLYPAVARRLLREPVNGTPMNDRTRKLILPLAGAQFSRSAVPLKALYVLASPRGRLPNSAIRIRPLSQRRAFVELLKNTFNSAVLESARLGRQFHYASEVASHIPMKLVSYPRRLAVLPAVREAILADLAR